MGSLGRGVVELELSAPSDSFTNAVVDPQSSDGVGDVSWEVIAFDLAGEGHDDRPAGVVSWVQTDVEDGHRFEDGTHGLDRV